MRLLHAERGVTATTARPPPAPAPAGDPGPADAVDRQRTLRVLVVAIVVLVAAGVGIGVHAAVTGSRTGGRGIPLVVTEAPVRAVHVQGNQLVGASGRPIRLLGVNRSGTEYACIEGWGIFDGPSDAASISAMMAWHIDAVRIPLNEDCWLGVNGVSPLYGGAAYRSAITAYVALLRARGLVVVLNLHWSAPGTTPATGQQVMADAGHSIAFWRSVAGAFRNDPAVVFDLYNEPHGISWSCWLIGCRSPGGWQTAGMQQLVDAVRGTGARQPIIAGGLGNASNLAGWSAHRPDDPAHQLVAGFHAYNFSGCTSLRCWNTQLGRVARSVPVVAGEIGENDCASRFVDRFMAWADRHEVSYLAWTWNTWGCAAGPALISSYAGTPTPFGAGVRAHLALLARSAGGRRDRPA